MRLVIAVPCLLTGAWLMLESLRAIVRGVRSRSWPAADAVIVSSRVVKKFNANPRGPEEVWREELEYSYVVHGTTYRGTRLRFGVRPSLQWSAMPERPLGYGARTPVVYNPSSPSVSALHRGWHPFALLPLLAGGLIGWFGLWMLAPLFTGWMRS